MLNKLQQITFQKRFQLRRNVRKERLGSLSAMLGGQPVNPSFIEPISRQEERARLLVHSGRTLRENDLRNGRRILEVVVDRDDRVPRSFLIDGNRTANAVCRVVTVTDLGELSLGTGFAVAPGLILTNNHVLPNWSSAKRGQIEFGFWSTAPDRQQSSVILQLDPETFFLTDLRLDFTLVAFEPKAAEAVHRVFGAIDILPRSGKALIGEPLNVIQHGDGGLQSISLRNNVVVDVFNDWIHYTSDTSQGSSGAPVLNDQWQLAALHHASFEYISDAGIPVKVNEGARISSIARKLSQML